MPKTLVRDPTWLVGEGTPGLELFQSDNDSNLQRNRTPSSPAQGPIRRIAHRGTETLVAVGNEIRWSDLTRLKDANGSRDEQAYRVLKTPVHREITQLSVAPSGDYLAVLTSHTCHICILPASSHLRSRNATPLRLKSFQLGPTAHVLEQSPLVSAIWHPLSLSGNCLITITHDACVRLWELDGENRSSFDEPALAIDLKKLGNATSLQADLSASKYGTNKGFSPDDVEMQVAAACFGGRGSDDEHGWASMTLWVAMTEGDLYALCPLLPTKWLAPALLLPTLSTSVVEKARSIRSDPDATEQERRVVDEQSKWLGSIDAQDPLAVPGRSEFETVEVYSRPDCLSAIPKLQGPFIISPEPDFGEITDVYVVGPKVDDEALYDDVDDDLSMEEGLSVSVICLATSTNEVHVCLDLDGVEAEWLPRKRSRAITLDDTPAEKELLLYETIDLANADTEDHGWPTFTASPLDRYELFVTCPSGVCGLSFRPWIGLLEDELSTPTESGAGLRLDVVLESTPTLVDQPIQASNEAGEAITTAISIVDPALGFLLLTSVNQTPYAAILDAATAQLNNPYLPDTETAQAALPAPEPRAPYRPSPAFEQPSGLPQLQKLAHDRGLLGPSQKSQIRFSPATLQIMTEAHRLMSTETHRLGLAAADLFRRCERMRSELQEQVRKVAEIAERVDNVTGEDDYDDEDAGPDATTTRQGEESGLTTKEKLDRRIAESRGKSALLNTRVDALRRRMLLLGGRELSVKEVSFAEEVQRLQASILDSVDDQAGATRRSDALTPRFDAVRDLHARLTEDAKAFAAPPKGVDVAEGEVAASAEPKFNGRASVAGGFRRQRLAQVMALLERETALIEAVGERLARLQT